MTLGDPIQVRLSTEKQVLLEDEAARKGKKLANLPVRAIGGRGRCIWRAGKSASHGRGSGRRAATDGRNGAGRISGTREYIVHPNYILVYKVGDDAIKILRVIHARREYP